MPNKNKPEHYKDVIKLFNSYRVAKSIITTHSDELMSQLDSDEKVRQNYENAQKIVQLADNAILRINFICKNGNRCARALFYRYMTDYPYNEDTVVEQLKSEGISKSKSTYHRLKEQGLQAACAFIWNDDVEVKLLQTISLPY